MTDYANSMTEMFGEPISVYTRADAIADGTLVDVTEMAREAGFNWPVAISSALDSDIRAIPKSKSYQDYTGRLWDVLFMGMFQMRRHPLMGEAYIALSDLPIQSTYRLIMHVGRYTNYDAKLVAGPGDHGEPTITIMRPEED